MDCQVDSISHVLLPEMLVGKHGYTRIHMDIRFIIYFLCSLLLNTSTFIGTIVDTASGPLSIIIPLFRSGSYVIKFNFGSMISIMYIKLSSTGIRKDAVDL